MSKHTIDDVVRVYRQIRDELAEKKKEFRAYEDAQNEKLEKLRGHLLNNLNKMGAKSINTEAGVAYKIEKTRLKIADATAFYTFVLQRRDPSLLEKRIAKEHTMEVLKDITETYPEFSPADVGIQIERWFDVGVRKGAT